MPSAIKEDMVAELTTRFRDMPHAIFVDYTGLGARRADALRAKLREQGARMLVIKNSLAARAFRQHHLDDVARLLTGPIAVIYGGQDPVALTKLFLDWSKKEQVGAVRGGLLGGRALDVASVRQLAALPPINVLRAQVLGAMAAPLSGFVGALQGIIRSFVGVVNSIAEKSEKQG
jgi:large subunit ribosomal protein L10